MLTVNSNTSVLGYRWVVGSIARRVVPIEAVTMTCVASLGNPNGDLTLSSTST